jgi:hypothetical protein
MTILQERQYEYNGRKYSIRAMRVADTVVIRAFLNNQPVNCPGIKMAWQEWDDLIMIRGQYGLEELFKGIEGEVRKLDHAK